jgi:pre-60S factor REI1
MNLASNSESASAEAPSQSSFSSSSRPVFGIGDVDVKSVDSAKSPYAVRLDRPQITRHGHVSHDFTRVSNEQYPKGEKSLGEEDEDESGASEASLEEDDPEGEGDFDPAQCLFCNHINSGLDDNLAHMLKMHGLFIPDKGRLVVDAETLIAYFHLIIFGYFECLYCNTQRSSAEAAQQHMMGKGHCKFDVSSEDSEFRDFYDFDSSHENDDEEDAGTSAKRLTLPFVQPDGTSLRLPSGKTLSHHSSRKPRPQQYKNRPDTDSTSSQLDPNPPTSSQSTSDSAPSRYGSGALTKAEKRDFAFTNQLVYLRADDRRSLMHLPTSQQRALLAAQKKQMDKARRAERMMHSRVERMGNKTLMKHFVNDVPGRLNG